MSCLIVWSLKRCVYNWDRDRPGETHCPIVPTIITFWTCLFKCLSFVHLIYIYKYICTLLEWNFLMHRHTQACLWSHQKWVSQTKLKRFPQMKPKSQSISYLDGSSNVPHLWSQTPVVEKCVVSVWRSFWTVLTPDRPMPSQAGALSVFAGAQTDAGSRVLFRALEKLLCSRRER